MNPDQRNRVEHEFKANASDSCLVFSYKDLKPVVEGKWFLLKELMSATSEASQILQSDKKEEGEQ